MSTWTTLGELPPGAMFETDDGRRGVKTTRATSSEFTDNAWIECVCLESAQAGEILTWHHGQRVHPLNCLVLSHDDPAQRTAVEQIKEEVRQRLEELHGLVSQAAGIGPKAGPGTMADRILLSLAFLHAMLGFSDAERTFMSDAANHATNSRFADLYDVVLIFADWLQEQGREVQGAALRRLVPADGEIITLTYPRQSSIERAKQTQESAREAIAYLQSELSKRGRSIPMVALVEDWTLNRLTDEKLEVLGLVQQWRCDVMREVAVREEREACARVALELPFRMGQADNGRSSDIARAIRARGIA